MATPLGIAITNLTSKVGILSRRASIRLATETGKKLVDKSREVGRILQPEEIQEVFTQTLPKKCRPKIISTEEVQPYLERHGLDEKQKKELMESTKMMGAATVSNLTKKSVIWLPYEKLSALPIGIEPIVNSAVAHELEHALEANHRFTRIIQRKFKKIQLDIGKFFDKNYVEKEKLRECGVHEFENQLQLEFLGCITPGSGNLAMKCEPGLEEVGQFLNIGGQKGMEHKIRAKMRNIYASAENQGSETDKRLRILRLWMDKEEPAYKVTGDVDRYGFNMKEGEVSINTGIANGYKAAKKIALKERLLYWKNKLFCKMKKPNVYMSDKDLMRYASTKEEKNMMNELIQNMDSKQKGKLIKFLYANEGKPNTIENIKKFLDETKVNGESLYINDLEKLEGISTDVLANPDFQKIARLTYGENAGNPVYIYDLKSISQAKPARIAEFAKIAGTRTPHISEDIPIKAEGRLKEALEAMRKSAEKNTDTIPCDEIIQYDYQYKYLANCILSPDFNAIKAFAEIRTPDGKLPYADMLSSLKNLPSERIKYYYDLAKTDFANIDKIKDSIFKEVEQIMKNTEQPVSIKLNLA